MPRASLLIEIRRLFRRGVGSATIVALLRCSYRDVNEALRAP
jgi:hypothetical protein